MKRLSENNPAATSQAGANSCRSWPGLFFKQRADFSFEWVASEMAKFIGTRKTVKGSPKEFWAIIHPADVELLQRQIELCKTSGRWTTHDYRICPSKDGPLAYISESRRALLDRRGKISGYEGFWIDVTRRTLAERKLLLAAWKETLADLTPGLAHEFNNVLTGILTMSEACLAQIDAGHAFHESLCLIKQKAQQAGQLIHRLNHLAQGKTGSRSYQDVNSMVLEVVEILRTVISKRIEVISKLSGDSLPVYVDAVEFRRVVLSVALSAVNALPGAGQLTINASRHKIPPTRTFLQGHFPGCPAICLSVRTAGDGLRGEHEGSSSPLHQAQDGTLDSQKLALHFAKAFSEKSGGAISVESKPGKGTTFFLWLAQANFTEA